MKKSFTILVLSALAFCGFGQETVTENSKFSFSGYIDSYYLFNGNGPKSRSNLGVSGYERAFDQKSNQFSLGLVQTKFNYTTKSTEAVVDLTFGPNADLGQYGNVIGALGQGKATSAIAIKQAYFNWKATSKLTFTVGQFGTHIGYEVIDAPLNYNYSLSNLFNNGPFYHIGAKAAYTISDKSALMVGVVNNVDNLNDNNSSKGLIAQYFISPKEGWNVYVNGITSDESNDDDGSSYSLLDLTTTYQLTSKFFLGLNAAYGSQSGDYQGSGNIGKDKTWGGVALYSHYDFSDKFSLGGRYEVFDNTSGARGLKFIDSDGNASGTDVSSLTLTATFTTGEGHLLIKPEIRTDAYKTAQFTDSKGIAQKSQTTFGTVFIYKF